MVSFAALERILLCDTIFLDTTGWLAGYVHDWEVIRTSLNPLAIDHSMLSLERYMLEGLTFPIVFHRIGCCILEDWTVRLLHQLERLRIDGCAKLVSPVSGSCD